MFAAKYSQLLVLPEMLLVERTHYPTFRGKELVCFLGLFKKSFFHGVVYGVETPCAYDQSGSCRLKMGVYGDHSQVIEPTQIGISFGS